MSVVLILCVEVLGTGHLAVTAAWFLLNNLLKII